MEGERKENTMGKIKDLKFDDKNFNKHTQRGMGLLDKSLRQYGAGRSILIDKNNRIIAGNGVVEAAGQIGLEDVQIVESDGKKIIAVKRTDVDLDSDQGREMALADNATAAADLEWDYDNMEKVGFTTEQLGEWDVFEVKKGIKDEKQIEDNPPTIVSSFLTYDYNDEITLEISEHTAQKLMAEMIKYREHTGTYDGFWDERLKNE